MFPGGVEMLLLEDCPVTEQSKINAGKAIAEVIRQLLEAEARKEDSAG